MHRWQSVMDHPVQGPFLQEQNMNRHPEGMPAKAVPFGIGIDKRIHPPCPRPSTLSSFLLQVDQPSPGSSHAPQAWSPTPTPTQDTSSIDITAGQRPPTRTVSTPVLPVWFFK